MNVHTNMRNEMKKKEKTETDLKTATPGMCFPYSVFFSNKEPPTAILIVTSEIVLFSLDGGLCNRPISE